MSHSCCSLGLALLPTGRITGGETIWWWPVGRCEPRNRLCVGKIFDIGFAYRLCGWRVMLVSCNLRRRMRRIERHKHTYLKKLKLHDLCKHHERDTGDRSSKRAGWLAGLNVPAYPVTVLGSIRQIELLPFELFIP